MKIIAWKCPHTGQLFEDEKLFLRHQGQLAPRIAREAEMDALWAGFRQCATARQLEDWIWEHQKEIASHHPGKRRARLRDLRVRFGDLPPRPMSSQKEGENLLLDVAIVLCFKGGTTISYEEFFEGSGMILPRQSYGQGRRFHLPTLAFPRILPRRLRDLQTHVQRCCEKDKFFDSRLIDFRYSQETLEKIAAYRPYCRGGRFWFDRLIKPNLDPGVLFREFFHESEAVVLTGSKGFPPITEWKALIKGDCKALQQRDNTHAVLFEKIDDAVWLRLRDKLPTSATIHELTGPAGPRTQSRHPSHR